jgi:hypothetical protein
MLLLLFVLRYLRKRRKRLRDVEGEEEGSL